MKLHDFFPFCLFRLNLFGAMSPPLRSQRETRQSNGMRVLHFRFCRKNLLTSARVAAWALSPRIGARRAIYMLIEIDEHVDSRGANDLHPVREALAKQFRKRTKKTERWRKRTQKHANGRTKVCRRYLRD